MVVTVLAIVGAMPAHAVAAHLIPATLQAWNAFIAKIDDQTRNQSTGTAFLRSDSIDGQVERLRQGEILVSPASGHSPIKVPSGLIHDWIGAAFIPGATLEGVVGVVRNYGQYKEFYRPTVVDSKLISREGSNDRFSILLSSKSTVAKTALDADFDCAHQRLDDRHWYSITKSTRVQEIAEYGTPSQHMLPEGEGKGLIWRLHTIVRLEEKDGGVYIEVEAIALSREIPAAVRWLVTPMVRRASRAALLTSLQQTEAAVEALRVSRQKTSGN